MTKYFTEVFKATGQLVGTGAGHRSWASKVGSVRVLTGPASGGPVVELRTGPEEALAATMRANAGAELMRLDNPIANADGVHLVILKNPGNVELEIQYG